MDHYDTMQGLPLAMAYVPWQPWQNVSDGARGLEQGSIFEELIFPFEYAGPGCRNTGNCHRSSFQNGTFTGASGPSCRQNTRQCGRQNTRQIKCQNSCQMPYQNPRSGYQDMQRQRREGCPCQEMTEKN